MSNILMIKSLRLNLQRHYLYAVLMMCACIGKAQVSSKSNLNDERFKGIIYRKETTGELILHNNGFAFALNFGDIRTYYRTSYYHFNIGMMGSPREYSQTKNVAIIDGILPKKFKFGKQNSVFIIRAGKGIKKYISDKAKRKGVSIGYNLEFGPALAVLKPTYLNFVEQRIVNGELQNDLVSKKYSDQTKSQFVDYDQIYGGASYGKGFSELGFLPGAQAKIGLFFSVGAFDEYVKAAEIGLMADAFIKKVPIMVETADNKNTPLFLNLYVHLHFGKRSN